MNLMLVRSLENTATVFVNKISQNQTLDKHINNCISNPGNAAKFLVMANVSKDVFKQGVFFNQSIMNQEIPENKRKYVASLDLAIGVADAFVQLVSGFTIANEKIQKKMCSFLFGQLRDKNSSIYKQFPQKIKYFAGRELITPEKMFRGCSKGFVAISTLVGSQIIAKRFVVPVISPALASVISNQYLAKNNSAVCESNKSGQVLSADRRSGLKATFGLWG